MSKKLEVYPDNMKEMYVEQRLSVKEISEKIGVSYPQTLKYIRDQGWIQEREEEDFELINNANIEFQKHVAVGRLPVAVNHMTTGELLASQVRKKLELVEAGKEYASPRELCNMAKALKDAADVSARSVGLSDKNFEGMGAETTQKSSTKLLVVGMQPKELPRPKKEAIDITDEVSILPPIEEDPF